MFLGASKAGAGTEAMGWAGVWRGIIPGGAAGPGGASSAKLGTAAGPGTAGVRSGVRRSIRMSLLSRLGVEAGGLTAAEQAVHSPTAGSSAPHFRHLDNGSSR